MALPRDVVPPGAGVVLPALPRLPVAQAAALGVGRSTSRSGRWSGSWPLQDKAGRHARGIPDQAEPIDVEVRLELSEDGEVWLPGQAQRLSGTHVYVSALSDPRIRRPLTRRVPGDVHQR